MTQASRLWNLCIWRSGRYGYIVSKHFASCLCCITSCRTMEVDSDSDWLVQVDLFFYREPDETKDREEEEGGIAEFVPVEYGALPLPVPGADTQWEADAPGQWEPDVASAAVPAVVAAPDWTPQGLFYSFRSIS